MAVEDRVERLLGEFREKAEPLGVTVLRVASSEAAGLALADWAHSLEADSVIVASDVTRRLPGICRITSEATMTQSASSESAQSATACAAAPAEATRRTVTPSGSAFSRNSSSNRSTWSSPATAATSAG